MQCTCFECSSASRLWFQSIQVSVALQYGVLRYREMIALDWQVLIVAFVAISLQILTSINLLFARSAVTKCNIWRETDHSPVEVFGRSALSVTPND